MPVKTENVLEGLPIPEFSSPREVVAELHAHLRQLIIDSLRPGTELNQADIARRYSVSRTPVREAFRMLQQEGLIDVQPNQRAFVRQLDAREVDQLYGVRVTLESLGVRITAGRLSEEDVRMARNLLAAMDDALTHSDMRRWITEHRHFHELCSARADPPLARIIHSYSELSERYLRFAQLEHPTTFAAARDEHERILEGLVAGEAEATGALMARHLAKTAELVLADLGFSEERGAVQEALRMAGGAVN
jgi:DNA-binding GntR family transcriptional regulator